MITPASQTPSMRETRAVTAIASPLLAYHDVLQAAIQNDAQTAIAFDKASVFGVASSTGSRGSSLQEQTLSPPPIETKADNTAFPIRASVADRQISQPEMLQPLLDRTQRRLQAPAVPRTLKPPSARAQLAIPASGSRAISNANALRESAAAKPSAPCPAKPLQPVMVAVQQTEQGLRVFARLRDCAASDLTELRDEAHALLTRHGYHTTHLDIASTRKD